MVSVASLTFNSSVLLNRWAWITPKSSHRTSLHLIFFLHHPVFSLLPLLEKHHVLCCWCCWGASQMNVSESLLWEEKAFCFGLKPDGCWGLCIFASKDLTDFFRSWGGRLQGSPLENSWDIWASLNSDLLHQYFCSPRTPIPFRFSQWSCREQSKWTLWLWTWLALFHLCWLIRSVGEMNSLIDSRLLDQNLDLLQPQQMFILLSGMCACSTFSLAFKNVSSSRRCPLPSKSSLFVLVPLFQCPNRKPISSREFSDSRRRCFTADVAREQDFSLRLWARMLFSDIIQHHTVPTLGLCFWIAYELQLLRRAGRFWPLVGHLAGRACRDPEDLSGNWRRVPKHTWPAWGINISKFWDVWLVSLWWAPFPSLPSVLL